MPEPASLARNTHLSSNWRRTHYSTTTGCEDMNETAQNRNWFASENLEGVSRQPRFPERIVVAARAADRAESREFVAGPAGVEPATPDLEGRCALH